jgi:uracil-DNA glycosylase family 4
VNNRDEAVLRELNLYPLWVRRDAPAGAEPAPAVAAEEARPAVVAAGEPVSQPSAATPAASSLNWPELKQQVRDCTACKLRAGCTQTVFGVGDEKAEWLFVGEGPGADEDVQGEPFVGQAGKLLDNMLAAIRLKRGSNVYIANIVKCRPPGNRTPEPDEVASCLPYLQRQIELIKPKLIVALGKTAATSLLGRDATLGSLRGTVHDYQLPATEQGGTQVQESSQQSPLPHPPTSSHRVGTTTPLIVTYHPAYLLRSPAEKAKAWQDLRFAVQRMAE